ncbi:hypothetical protein [uncultured Clostridium sp.]|uniref:hypothetical protein n=1 Tax=uncultured Clostridium sp. TaxID=59620 RepID=UPI00263207A1|nr:hypothetical protein [uncultured Clostridium sp.]
MLKRVTLEEGIQTQMGEVFQAIDNMQLEYNFLITNYEGYSMDEEIENKLSRNYSWMSGKELTELIKKGEDFQWIWGVLIAFSKEIALESVLSYDLPSLDGNPKIWGVEPIIQNPLGEFEIIAFDSSLTMIVSKNKKIIELFKKNCPLAKEL